MSECWLYCDVCEACLPFEARFFGCPTCRERGKWAPLEMRYENTQVKPTADESGVWRWRDLLPPVEPRKRISLGEGGTCLLPLSSDSMGPRLLLKNETTNPTWSWKDRPNSVSVSVARHFGFKRITAKSTGNHGNSVAAYGAAGGLSSVIFCHEGAPALQLALMEAYGARVVRGGMQDEMLLRLVIDDGYFPCTILCPRAGYTNPYGVEGFKTIAFEICEKLDWMAPDRVFVPVGSGDGVYGIWKGFRELAERRKIAKAPRMVGCQAAGANSAYLAWRGRSRHVRPLSSIATVALSVGELVTGDHALRAIYESEGCMMVATDAEILQAAQGLMRKGLALEPASALGFACAGRVADSENQGETWVVIGSGAAIKWPDGLLRNYQLPAMLEETVVRWSAERGNCFPNSA